MLFFLHAITFSFIPPTFNISPFRVISPVIDILLVITFDFIKDNIAVVIAIPAYGPSFDIPPSVKWIWMSFSEKNDSFILNFLALLFI